MKRMITGLCSLFMLFAISAQAQEKKKHEFVKEKNITKTYSASGNKLKIRNQFGNVTFNTSSGNEIKVNVHVEASADKEDVAQKVFDRISVTDKQEGNTITFKTSFDDKNDKNRDCKNCSSSMQINYEVSLPASVTIDVDNSFGNTTIPDYSGEVSVTNKFGNLTAGKLANVKDISVEFGKAEIKSLVNIDATFKFSSIRIDNLSGKSKVNLEFCDGTTIGLDNSLASLKLRESYSTVNLRPNGNISANYNITTSFGSVVDRSNANIKRTDTPDKYGPDSDRTYSGQSGSGGAKIDVSSSFGKIIVGDANEDDMKKDKAKNKSKKVTL